MIYSPHFDQLPAGPWTSLNCPAGPVHVIGRPGDRSPDTLSYLTFRLRSYPRRGDGLPGDVPLVGAMVVLESRIYNGLEQRLPLDERSAAMTDSDGSAHLQIAGGTYRASFSMIGLRSGESILRARAGRTDTILVFMDPEAIC